MNEKREFLTRIEFHGSTALTEYEKLNAMMERKGFSRKIRNSVSDIYYLPTAEYFIETELNRDQVIAAAIKIANTMKKNIRSLFRNPQELLGAASRKQNENHGAQPVARDKMHACHASCFAPVAPSIHLSHLKRWAKT